jgi:acyl-CoA synthetase (NDP forming)
VLHGGVEHRARGAPDVRTRPVAFDERDDGVVGDVEFAVLKRDFLPVLRDRDAVVALHCTTSLEDLANARPWGPPLLPWLASKV